MRGLVVNYWDVSAILQGFWSFQGVLLELSGSLDDSINLRAVILVSREVRQYNRFHLRAELLARMIVFDLLIIYRLKQEASLPAS